MSHKIETFGKRKYVWFYIPNKWTNLIHLQIMTNNGQDKQTKVTLQHRKHVDRQHEASRQMARNMSKDGTTLFDGRHDTLRHHELYICLYLQIKWNKADFKQVPHTNTNNLQNIADLIWSTQSVSCVSNRNMNCSYIAGTWFYPRMLWGPQTLKRMDTQDTGWRQTKQQQIWKIQTNQQQQKKQQKQKQKQNKAKQKTDRHEPTKNRMWTQVFTMIILAIPIKMKWHNSTSISVDCNTIHQGRK